MTIDSTPLSDRIRNLTTRRDDLQAILLGAPPHSDLATECQRRIGEYDAEIDRLTAILKRVESYRGLAQGRMVDAPDRNEHRRLRGWTAERERRGR